MNASTRRRIALRYLIAPKTHSAVNIISMVSMAGICVATMAMVIVLSVFNGFHELIGSRLNVLDPPLLVVPTQGKVISQADSLCEALKAQGITAVPEVEERALAMAGQRQMAVKLHGIPQELYGAFDSLSLAGEPWIDFHPAALPAVVSVGVANQLQLPIGTADLLGLYVPRRVGRINPANPMGAFRADSVAVTSAFALNQPEYDRDAVYAPLPLVRRLLQYDTEATKIHVLNSTDRERVQALLGPSVRVLTRMEQQASSFKIVNMEKWLTFLILGFILAVASFNIISSLSLLIIEKRDNAKTLRALGASDKDIRGIYRLCGFYITAAGGLLGMILGTLLSLGQQHFGWVKLAGDASALSVTAYPVAFNPVDLLPVAAVVAAIGLLTSMIFVKN